MQINDQSPHNRVESASHTSSKGQEEDHQNREQINMEIEQLSQEQSNIENELLDSKSK